MSPTLNMDVDGTANEDQKDIACPLPETSPESPLADDAADLVSTSRPMADLNYIFTYS